MKLSYYPDTDSLYIDLSARPSAESREVSEGVVLDYDEDANLVGIDIDNCQRLLRAKSQYMKARSTFQSCQDSVRSRSGRCPRYFSW